MCRLSTQGAGRKDSFLARYLPRRPGGGAAARSYKIVRVQRPRAVGVARPCPPRSADVRPVPWRLCPVHVHPQCKQCRLARWGVAHCCARGHAGHPAAMAGAAASSRVLQVSLAPPEPPPEPLAKRPCVAPVPAVAGRRQRPDYRSLSPTARRSRCRVLCPGWGILPPPPPPPRDLAGAPAGGGGGQPERAESLNGLGLMGLGGHLHPPRPPSPDAGALGVNTAPGGGA